MSNAKDFTRNNTSQTKITQQTARERARGDNTIRLNKAVNFLTSYIYLIKHLQDKFDLRQSEVMVLLHLYKYYATTGNCANCMKLLNLYSGGNGGIKPIQERVKRLFDVGLIEYSGINRDKRRGWQYVPTVKACNYLSRLSLPD